VRVAFSMKSLPPKSLLDTGKLPIAELAGIAMREGIRPRDAYQAHKWFARRFAVTARALLVATAANEKRQFWPLFYKGDSWVGRTVLDPFVGGGVMLLEARRLGANVFGLDIEPVAAAIAKFQTELRELPVLESTLKLLQARVGNAMKPFYVTQSPDGEPQTLIHTFWVQQIKCKGCGHCYDGHPTFRFAWDEQKSRQWVACSTCSTVLRGDGRRKNLKCECGATTHVESGHVRKGEACCPKCGTCESLIDYSRRKKRPPSFRIFAVEVLPAGDSKRVDISLRQIRSATVFDTNRYLAARRTLNSLLRSRPRSLPSGPIPSRRRTDMRLIDYGYRDYRDLFNARQQLHLALLGREISALKGKERKAMAIAFSDHLTTNNMMCAYAGGWRRLTPLFSIRAYRHIPRPVELNPWLQNNGRGTFPNAVRSVTRASEALKNPTEPTPMGLVKAVSDAPPGKSNIECRDARDLSHISDASIDMVLTDPPYFDYISYSELGHFFAPWLARFGLIERRGARALPRAQLASKGRSLQAELRFTRKLCEAFKEIRRVCRPKGRVVFTYQNLDGRGWNAIAKALAKAGIHPINTFPLYGDAGTSLHKKGNSISWDCVMVCRLGAGIANFSIAPQALEQGKVAAGNWAKRLAHSNLRLSSGDKTNIASAASIVAEFVAREEAKNSVAAEKREAGQYRRLLNEEGTLDGSWRRKIGGA
jgi:putative DNA methylase